MNTTIRVHSAFPVSPGSTFLRPLIPLPPHSLALPVACEPLGFRTICQAFVEISL